MDVLSLDQEVGAWDSVLLDPLTEDSFIANLHQRFKRDHIYVSGNSFMYSWIWDPHPSYLSDYVLLYCSSIVVRVSVFSRNEFKAIWVQG